MKHFLTALSFFYSIMFASVTFSEPLRFASEGAYPPFNIKTADGQLAGFDIDIANALCTEMKRECVIVAQDWDGIIPGLMNKKYDAIIASISITEERLKSIDFSDPYYSNYISVVVPKDSGLTMKKLSRSTLGAQRATIAAKWSEDKFGRRANIKLYDTQTAAYADLVAGRVDALVSDYLPAAEWLKSNQGFELVGDKIDVGDKIGVGLRKGDIELKAALNKAIKVIRKNGVYKSINEKYFPVDIF